MNPRLSSTSFFCDLGGPYFQAQSMTLLKLTPPLPKKGPKYHLGENPPWSFGCLLGQDYKGGNGKGGIHICLPVHCLSAAAVLQSHTCDIPSLLKDDQLARDNRLPLQCRRLRSSRHCIVIPVATQMSIPLVCLPPVVFKRLGLRRACT